MGWCLLDMGTDAKRGKRKMACCEVSEGRNFVSGWEVGTLRSDKDYTRFSGWGLLTEHETITLITTRWRAHPST